MKKIVSLLFSMLIFAGVGLFSTSCSDDDPADKLDIVDPYLVFMADASILPTQDATILTNAASVDLSGGASWFTYTLMESSTIILVDDPENPGEKKEKELKRPVIRVTVTSLPEGEGRRTGSIDVIASNGLSTSLSVVQEAPAYMPENPVAADWVGSYLVIAKNHRTGETVNWNTSLIPGGVDNATGAELPDVLYMATFPSSAPANWEYLTAPVNLVDPLNPVFGCRYYVGFTNTDFGFFGCYLDDAGNGEYIQGAPQPGVANPTMGEISFEAVPYPYAIARMNVKTGAIVEYYTEIYREIRLIKMK